MFSYACKRTGSAWEDEGYLKVLGTKTITLVRQPLIEHILFRISFHIMGNSIYCGYRTSMFYPHILSNYFVVVLMHVDNMFAKPVEKGLNR